MVTARTTVGSLRLRSRSDRSQAPLRAAAERRTSHRRATNPWYPVDRADVRGGNDPAAAGGKRLVLGPKEYLVRPAHHAGKVVTRQVEAGLGWSAPR